MASNVHTLDSEHTPVRGLPISREEATVRTGLPSHSGTFERDPDAPQPTDRKRSLTGMLLMRAGEGGGTAGWPILLAVLLGSGGATAGLSSLGSPAIEPERVMAIEHTVALAAAKDAEQDRAIADASATVALVDSRTRESEQKLWAEQIRTSRWMATEIQSQSRAIEAIAAKLNVKVELAGEPLVIGGAPTP